MTHILAPATCEAILNMLIEISETLQQKEDFKELGLEPCCLFLNTQSCRGVTQILAPASLKALSGKCLPTVD